LERDSVAGTGMAWTGSSGRDGAAWSASRPGLWLVPIGATSLLLYLWFFLKPYPLLAYYAVPLLDLGKLTGYSHAAARGFVLAFLLLFALSYAAYVLCRGRSSSLGLLLVLLFAFLCGLTLVLVYPITAADIFEYVAYARVTVYHGLNPHLYRPMDFPDDPLMRYSAWPHITSPYGPVWTYLSTAIGVLSGSSLLTYLLLFKGLALAVHLLNSALIYLTLRRWRPSQALSGTVLYAWNPLVLYESAAGGHNDGLVVFFTLLGVYLFVRGQITLSIPAAALSCLVKMPMAIVVPLFLVGGWRASSGRKNRLRTVALGLTLALVLIILLHAPWWEGRRSLGWLAREDLFTSSFATLAALALQRLAGDAELARGVVRNAVLGLFGLFYVWQLMRLRGETRHFTVGLYWTVFVFLCLAVLWFQPWYVVWLVALGAMAASGRVGRLTMLFAYTATWNYVVYIFFLRWFYPYMVAGSSLGMNLTSVLIIFFPPLAYAVYLAARGRLRPDLEG
jgi:hypothetical protein